MTDLDVSLRVRLAYESGAAKTALADMDAIRAGAARIGAQTGPALAARGLGEIGKQAAVSRVGVDELARAGARLAGAAGVAPPVAPPGAPQRGAVDWGARRGADQDWGSYWKARAAGSAEDRPRAGAWVDDGAPDRSAEVKASAAAARPATGSRPSEAAAQGTRDVDHLRTAADKLGAVSGTTRLADGIASVSPAAVEARRHIDDVGTAAHAAARQLETMGKASGSAEAGAKGGHAGHGAGGGGLRAALIAGARPLRMERLVMSAFTPVGAAGLAGGLGLAEVVHGLKSATGQAIDFERAMVEVKRAAGDMPAEGIKQIEEQILRVSRVTGASKDELAGLGAEALHAGRSAADLPRFLELGAKTAQVMGTKVDETGARLVQLGRAWGKDQAGVEDTVDTVTLASERTGAKASDVLDFTARHSDQRVRGMSARQVAAFGAGFQGSGLDAGQAEGAFGSLSEKLLNPQNAGPQFEFALGHELETNPTKARVGMRQDPTRTMVGVLDKLKALPEGKRANVLERMFGEDGGRDIARVVDHLDILKSTLGLVESEAQRHGALDRSFAIFDDTTSAKIDRAGAALGAFAVKVGRAFTPIVGAAADATARLVNGLGDTVQAHPHAAAAVGAGVGVAGAVGAVMLGKNMLGGFGLGKAATELQEAAVALKGAATVRNAGAPGQPPGGGTNPGLASRLLPLALGIGGAALNAPDITTPEGAQQMEGNAAALDAFGTRLERWLGVEWAKRKLYGIPEAREGRDEREPPRRRFAHGGRVSGPGGPREDRVPALLSHGEFVVRASEAAKHHGLLTALNDGGVPAFATGGPVGMLQRSAGDESASARVLQRGMDRAADPDKIVSLLAGLSPDKHDGRAPTPEQLKEAIHAGTKAGIIAGMREMMDMRGPDRHSLLPRPQEPGDDGADNGSHGDEGSRARPSLRYGGGYGPGGRRDPDGSVHHRSLRFHGGYGPRHEAADGHPEGGDPGAPRDRARPGRGTAPHGRARHRGADDATPSDDGSPKPPMPDGGEGRADPASLKGVLFKGESGGNPGIYNHRVGGRYRTGHLDPNNTTVSELMRRQAAGEVFAAGKYQVIPKTMQGAAKALHLKGDEKFDSALQDRIYTDYLAGSKRPQISAYVTGKSDNLRGANIATAEEWASVGDPSRGGRGHYDGDGANHASISVDKAQSALRKARDDYQHLVQQGVDPETARRSALLGIRDPQAPGQPRPTPPVAARPPASPPPVAEATPAAPERQRRTAAAQPAAPVRMATGGRVVGPGGPREDRVSAMLSHGEFIVRASAAARHPGLLAAINDDQVPGSPGRGGSLSARFSDPSARPSPMRSADEAGSTGGAPGGRAASGPSSIQNFYGMHDPGVTARRAMQEANRSVRRTQARALHSVGRTA